MDTSNEWDAALYDHQYGFVWKHGIEVVDMLSPQPGERILDLGCGTGHLTALIAERGADTLGIDASSAMIEQARRHYPDLSFVVQDARDLASPEPLDAVFTNAALHWIAEPASVLARVHQALKPGGRFIGEFGGQGNLQRLFAALAAAMDAHGIPGDRLTTSWYFPTASEYAGLLEQQGFVVVTATLFDRMTPLEGGEHGLEHWMRMFVKWLFEDVSLERQQAVRAHMEAHLRPTLYRDGFWLADYRRLRFHARRI